VSQEPPQEPSEGADTTARSDAKLTEPGGCLLRLLRQERAWALLLALGAILGYATDFSRVKARFGYLGVPIDYASVDPRRAAFYALLALCMLGFLALPVVSMLSVVPLFAGSLSFRLLFAAVLLLQPYMSALGWWKYAAVVAFVVTPSAIAVTVLVRSPLWRMVRRLGRGAVKPLTAYLGRAPCPPARKASTRRASLSSWARERLAKELRKVEAITGRGFEGRWLQVRRMASGAFFSALFVVAAVLAGSFLGTWQVEQQSVYLVDETAVPSDGASITLVVYVTGGILVERQLDVSLDPFTHKPRNTLRPGTMLVSVSTRPVQLASREIGPIHR